MSTPEEQTYEQRVNEAVSTLVNEEGKLTFADDMDEGFRFAVTAEKRRRDTQSAFTKAQMENARLQAEANHLAQGWQKDFASSLPPTVQAELEELKHINPEEWRAKLNALETERQAHFDKARQEISVKAKGESELDFRKRALEQFVSENPNLELNDDVIANDLPPRFVKQLEAGEVTFPEFLNNAATYLSKNKVVKPAEEVAGKPVNLSKVTGSASPSDDAQNNASLKTYSDEIF